MIEDSIAWGKHATQNGGYANGLTRRRLHPPVSLTKRDPALACHLAERHGAHPCAGEAGVQSGAVPQL